MSANQEHPSPVFVTLLAQAIGGTTTAKDMCQSLLQHALEEFSLHISKSFQLPYEKVKQGIPNIIHTCFLDTPHTCKGMLKSGQPCGRKAVLNGYCALHEGVGKVKEEKRRRLESYESVVSHQRIAQHDTVIADVAKHATTSRHPYVDIADIL